MDYTFYSEYIEGSEGNYGWKVKFDKTTPRGYIGITQPKDGECERVLLSPKQVKELVKFIAKQHKERE